MAITTETLQNLAGRWYGPVSVSSTADGFYATFAEKTALVALDGQTVLVRLREQVTWPAVTALTEQETDHRVMLALTAVALTRPELLIIHSDRQSSRIDVTLWLDAEHADVYQLATAVRTAAAVAELARDAVDQVVLNLATEKRMLDAAREAEWSVREAEAVLGQTRPPAAPMAAGGVATPSEPAAAGTTAARHTCARCGAALLPEARFCLQCGTPVA